MLVELNDTIVAPSTPPGSGALAIIRISGDNCMTILQQFVNKELKTTKSHTVHLVEFAVEKEIIDECIIAIYKGSKSYTGQDTIEINCHGSPYIIRKIMAALISGGARPARPGEFTQRAFLNGKLDLTQAEAVGDLISSKTASQHRLALGQMKGKISSNIKELRQGLIKFASLIELENDFSEEDVEFVDRQELNQKVDDIIQLIQNLEHSFEYGSAIKNGIPVAIVGAPNVGKSTLLNNLLGEDKAIVSDIPGTTRDSIEDVIDIGGYEFRFVDTAGIRNTAEPIEKIGISRTFQAIEKARIILFVAEFDENYQNIVQSFKSLNLSSGQFPILLINKVDKYSHQCHAYDVEEAVSTLTGRNKTILISAQDGTGIDLLKESLLDYIINSEQTGQDIIISNTRHLHSLTQTKEALLSLKVGLENNIPSDLVAIDLRRAMAYLGEISGEISTDDLLESIFSDFCIGK